MKNLQEEHALVRKALNSQKVELKMPDGSGGMAYLPVDPEVEAWDHEQFFTAFSHMVLATRPSGDWNSDYEQGLFQMMMEKNDVKTVELYNAFFRAYSDQYVPKSGIEWRHLWKHIEEMRKGRDRRYYTYKEMLDVCDREHIDTGHFEFIEEDKWKRK